MNELPTALQGLADYNQFILWRPIPNGVKTIKKPINPYTGYTHDPHDSSIWMSSANAIESLKKYPGYGLGFVFTDNDPFYFIDIDGCLLESGKWSNVAKKICKAFNGNAVELSQSGTGLHIFGAGKVPDHACKDNRAGIEFYHTKRFAALTGINCIGDISTPAPDGALNWLIAEYSGLTPTTHTVDGGWTVEPSSDWYGPLGDDELIDKMLQSTGGAGVVFGDKASIQTLWNADAELLADYFPDDVGTQGRAFDWSSAEAALCSHLAFWTGKNCDRINRLMMRSGLRRDKWINREKYREDTILKAVSGCNAVYCNRPVIESAPESNYTALSVEFKQGYQLVTPDQQVTYFKGCAYISSYHQIFTPNGMMLKPEQFKATYGGYIFSLDAENSKTTTNAWEVFTQSQVIKFPKVSGLVFRPDKLAGAIIEDEGLTMFNSYVPINVDREKGDCGPFLDLVRKLFPNSRDREIILGYMAACIQYPGKKFQWAPLIQGCEGNGKSLLLTAVSRAVGIRYTHKPPARDISNVFNAWITGKLFIAVEEVYAHDNREVMDALKPLITDSRVPVTPKGVDQVTGDNRANFICTSNHKNAIKVARKNNRRWCIFYTPQQSEDDLIRDGMGGLYFPNLYNWFENRGHAIISEFLYNYNIPAEFDPSLAMHRAPQTSSKDEIITQTLTGIEQEIVEAIGEDKYGFRNGWVSSMAVGKLFERRKINHSTKHTILIDLGYIHHPGLKQGRVNNPIPLEGGKPKLYIKSNSEHISIIKPTDIVAKYLHDQGILT